MANHTVILLHGVETRSGAVNWPTKLESMWQGEGSSLRIKTRSYGGVVLNRVPAVVTLIPWAGSKYREKIVAEQKQFMDLVYGHANSGDRISIIAHSFGGFLVSRLLEMGYKFHKIILVAPAAPARFDFKKVEECFHRVYVFWSPTDGVIKWAFYGRMGRVGVKKPHSRVLSYPVPLAHSEWFEAEHLTHFSQVWNGLLTEEEIE